MNSQEPLKKWKQSEWKHPNEREWGHEFYELIKELTYPVRQDVKWTYTRIMLFIIEVEDAAYKSGLVEGKEIKN